MSDTSILTWWITPRNLPGRALLGTRGPAKPQRGDQEAERAPGDEHGEIAELDPGSRRLRIERREEGLEEMPEGEHVGEAEHPIGDLALRDEDPGDEVERQRDRVRDRRGLHMHGAGPHCRD